MRRWIRPAAFLLALLAVVAGAVAVAGAGLPREHEVTRSAHFGQPPEVVWDVITDFESHPEWVPDVQLMERAPAAGGGLRWRETSRFGTVTYEIDEAVEPVRLVTRIVDADAGYGGTWIYEIEPDAGGSSVSITERGRVDNPLFRFMGRYVFGYDATVSSYLHALAGRLGEAPTPEAAGG